MVRRYGTQASWRISTLSQVKRFGASIVLTGAVIEAGWLMGTNSAMVMLNLVLAVLVVAATWGFREALIACGTGILGLDYFFLPPDGFGIADPREWWLMAAFVFTALVGSSLSSRARKRAIEADASRAEMEQLYRLSQAIRICDNDRETIQRAMEQTRQIFGFREVACHDSTNNTTFTSTGSTSGPSRLDARLRDGADGLLPLKSDSQDQISFLPLQLEDDVTGSIGFCGPPYTAPLRQSIAAMVSSLLKTCKDREENRRVAEIRSAQGLRAALLDVVAHELKTPLTSITAAASCLLSQCTSLAEEDRELLRIIREEAERLGFAADTVTSKVLNEVPQSVKYAVDVSDVVQAAVEQFDATLARRIEFTEAASEAVPPVELDPNLIEQVLVQLLDNALKYSPADSPVIVSARSLGDSVVVSIADSGPGIAEEEQGKIFQPSYRAPQHEHLAGSGMGLAITKRLMEAHGGNVWVTSRKGRGSVFHFSVTAAQAVMRG